MTNIARHWRAFRSDPPGRRFANHFSRMRRGSWVGAIARVGLGLALVVAGIVLLVVPGPGLLVMLFGVGLIAGESQRFAGLLDRAAGAATRTTGAPVVARSLAGISGCDGQRELRDRRGGRGHRPRVNTRRHGHQHV